jgi:Meiotically up-regulated gene 113
MDLKIEQEKMRQRQILAQSTVKAIELPEIVLKKEKGRRRHGVRYWTYLIRGELTGLIKIGRSHNIIKRFRSLKTSSPDVLSLVGVIVGDYERTLHLRFQKYRVRGEWFNPEVLPLISSQLEVLPGEQFLPKQEEKV